MCIAVSDCNSLAKPGRSADVFVYPPLSSMAYSTARNDWEAEGDSAILTGNSKCCISALKKQSISVLPLFT
jgi:hypothetical protein